MCVVVDLKRVVQGAVYSTRGTFSHPLKFANLICDDRSNRSVTKCGDVVDFLDERATFFRSARGSSEVTPLHKLVAQDLDRVAVTVRSAITDEDLEEATIRQAFTDIRHFLDTQGFSLGDGSLRIDDRFPDPYSGIDFWAMNYDVSDRRKYGLAPGVVLKRAFLMPLYSKTLLAHELTHTVLGQIDSDHLARGLEEGLADLFGGLYVASRVVDPEICKNHLLNSRFLYPQEQLWALYTEALRQAGALTNIIGWNSVLQLIREANRAGRGLIKDAERNLLSNNRMDGLNSATVSATPRDIALIDSFVRESLTYPQSLVVSPSAFVVASKSSIGQRVEAVFEEAGISAEAGEDALRELRDQVYLLIIKDGVIEADESKNYLKTGTLRYRV
jgi:hypothetical protein